MSNEISMHFVSRDSRRFGVSTFSKIEIGSVEFVEEQLPRRNFVFEGNELEYLSSKNAVVCISWL